MESILPKRERVQRAPEPPRLSASALLQGTREVILVHGTEEYRLKLTASGKLILTK